MKRTLRLAARHLLNTLLALLLVAMSTESCVSNLGDFNSRSPERSAQITMHEFKGALEMFRFDIGRYPTTEEGLSALVRNPGIPQWHGPYRSAKEIPADPWGHPYVYGCPGKDGGYDLFSHGRDRKKGNNAEDQIIPLQ
jgi:general secretion pathway protein G